MAADPSDSLGSSGGDPNSGGSGGAALSKKSSGKGLKGVFSKVFGGKSKDEPSDGVGSSGSSVRFCVYVVLCPRFCCVLIPFWAINSASVCASACVYMYLCVRVPGACAVFMCCEVSLFPFSPFVVRWFMPWFAVLVSPRPAKNVSIVTPGSSGGVTPVLVGGAVPNPMLAPSQLGGGSKTLTDESGASLSEAGFL